MAMSHPAERGAAPVTVLVGKVIRVIDGDTIDVLLSSGTIRVRLHGIDLTVVRWLLGIPVAWFTLAVVFFHRGLRRYSSASS